MVWIIIAITIATCIASTNHQFGHMTQINRPIFIGFVAGLLLGDMKTGILIGAQLELAFLGVSSIGGAQSADPETATICTVGFVCAGSMPMEAAIPLGITIGYLAAPLRQACFGFAEFFIPWRRRALANDNDKQYYVRSVVTTLITDFLVKSAINVAAVVLGGVVLEGMINNLPQFVIVGITAAGKMLPALGMCMLLTNLFSKEVAIFFFTGFIVYKVLEVNMIFCLVMGLLLAFLVYMIDSKKDSGVAVSNNDSEGDFFS